MEIETAIEKIEILIKEYESNKKLSEYAKGRLAGLKFSLSLINGEP